MFTTHQTEGNVMAHPPTNKQKRKIKKRKQGDCSEQRKFESVINRTKFSAYSHEVINDYIVKLKSDVEKADVSRRDQLDQMARDNEALHELIEDSKPPEFDKSGMHQFSGPSESYAELLNRATILREWCDKNNWTPENSIMGALTLTCGHGHQGKYIVTKNITLLGLQCVLCEKCFIEIEKESASLVGPKNNVVAPPTFLHGGPTKRGISWRPEGIDLTHLGEAGEAMIVAAKEIGPTPEEFYKQRLGDGFHRG